MLFNGREINKDRRQKNIVSSEHSKKHIAHNVNRNVLYQYRVDGDLITDNDLRCDFLLENDDKKRVYLIELKGSDLCHAVEQIANTIKRFSQQLNGYIILPRIVCRSNTHNIHQLNVLKFKKTYPNYLIKDNFIEEDVSI